MQSLSFLAPQFSVRLYQRCVKTSGSLRRISAPSTRSKQMTLLAMKETEPTEDSKETKEEDEEIPIWVRRERMKELQAADASGKFELPFFVSLPLSAVIAIAAVGSVFEFINRNPVFGVIQPDSPFWLPILAFFGLTGLPVSGFFFFSAVEAANKLADRMDKIDKA